MLICSHKGMGRGEGMGEGGWQEGGDEVGMGKRAGLGGGGDYTGGGGMGGGVFAGIEGEMGDFFVRNRPLQGGGAGGAGGEAVRRVGDERRRLGGHL